MKKGNYTISSILKGSKVIDKIMKGTLTVYESFIELIASGVPPINLQKCKGVDLVDYKIYGDSKQEGTPTPETPVEVKSVGDKTNNLFRPARGTFTHAGVAFTENEDGTYTLNGTATANTDVYIVRTSDTDSHIPVYTGKYYKLSRKVISGSYSGKYNINASTYNGSSLVKWGWLTDTGGAKTPDVDCAIKAVVFYMQTGAVFNNFRIGIQIEEVESESSTATEFEPYGYRIPIKVRGKNHINIKHLGDINNWDTTPTYGSYEISLPNGNYIFNIETDLEEYKSNILFLSKNKSSSKNPIANIISGYGSIVDKQLKFTITNNEKIYLNWYNGTKNQSNLTKLIDDVLINFIIEDGDVFTGYEPYIEPVTTNIYLNEPLRKIGDYADYIDFENQKVFRQLGGIALDKSLPYVFYKYNTSLDNTYHFYIDARNKAEPQIIEKTNMLCNRFKAGSISMNDVETDSFLTTRYGYRIYGQIEKALIDGYEGSTEKDKLIAFLTENYTEIAYVLANPKEEDVVLPNIPTHKGTNIIEVDTNILPSNMEVKYIGKE